MESAEGRLLDPHQLPLLKRGKDGKYVVTFHRLNLTYPVHFRDGGMELMHFIKTQLTYRNCTINMVASLQITGVRSEFSPEIQAYTSLVLDLHQNGSSSIRLKCLGWATYCSYVPSVRTIKFPDQWETLYTIHSHGLTIVPACDPPSDVSIVTTKSGYRGPIEKLAQWLDKWAHIAKLVDPTIDPHETSTGSQKMAWFICHCGHRHCTVIRDVTRSGRRTCGYCAPGGKICQDVAGCNFCHDRRFINHWRAPFCLDDPGLLIMVSTSSRRPLRFRCEEGHDFELSPGVVSRGSWCKICRNKTEALVTAFLATSPLNFETQEHVPNPNGAWPFRVDWTVTLPDGNRVVVELDGDQHFRPVKHWGGKDALVVGRARDIYKMVYFLNHGRRIIRLKQVDVLLCKSFDWHIQLKDSILNGRESIMYLERDSSKDSWRELRAEIAQCWEMGTDVWLDMYRDRLLDVSEDVDLQ
jgi:very-short-patch-repair endonuclease